MDVLWRILKIISIPRPYYTSEELAVVRVPHENYPPVSGYRILVSMVVIAFGIGKAACGYVGLPTAANSIDWTFAVVVTSMYVLFPPLSLQRNSDLRSKVSMCWVFTRITRSSFCLRSSSQITPMLFRTVPIKVRIIVYHSMHFSHLRLGFIFSLYALGLFTCGTWTNFWLRILIGYLYEPFVLDRQIRSDFDEIHNLSVQIVLIFVLLISVVLGITLILIQLWAIGRAVPIIRTFTRVLRRRFLSALATRIPPLYSQAYTRNIFLSQALTIRKYTTSMHSGFHPFQLILDQQFLELDEHSSIYFCTCLVLPRVLRWVWCS